MRRKHAAAAVSPFWSDTLDEFESDSELEFEFESDFESDFEITGPHPQVDTVLPRKGPGFYSYHPGSPKRQYGTARTILALQAIGARWLVAHPGGPRIGIGDISFPGGGKMSPHVSHQLGVDVDLRLMRSDGKEAGGTYRDSTYSRALTQELVDIIRANTVQGVKMILNNDPKIKGVKPWHGHDDHLHVRFDPGAASGPQPKPTTPAPSPSSTPAPTGGTSMLETWMVRGRIVLGERDPNVLTNLIFFFRHPELPRQPLRAGQESLMAEWKQILRDVVKPALAAAPPSAGTPASTPTPSPATTPATSPAPTDIHVASALKRWNLATGLADTPRFFQLVDRWRPAHLPLPLLVAFTSLEGSFNDATHGTEKNNWTKPAFYELGMFQVPAGKHGTCTAKQYSSCAHSPPGEDPAATSPWFKIAAKLGLDPRNWRDPTTQVRIGLVNLETDAATVRRLFPDLFQNKGSDWDLRAAVLLPFGPGIGYTIKLLRKHRAQLTALAEGQRWDFLRAQGAKTENVDKKMTLARGLAATLGLSSSMPA